MKKLLLVPAFLFLACISIHAQNENSNLKGEKGRVAQGVKSGEITKNEAKVIKNQAGDVRQAKKTAHADGNVTRNERKVIARQDRQLDRTIHKTKHNNRRRG